MLKDKVRSYAKGEFASAAGGLRLSTDRLEGRILPHVETEGSFTISSDSDLPLEGNVEVFDPCIHLSSDSISASRCTIHFTVSSGLSRPGDVIKGVFHIMTNAGEADLPYSFSVEMDGFETSEGIIHDFKAFAELEARHFDEALSIFCSDRFVSVLADSGEGAAAERIYTSLKSSTVPAQAMDEFLITMGLKKRISVEPVKRSISITYDSEDVASDIPVKIDGTGYMNVTASCKDPAVFISRSVLGRDDFLGGQGSFPIVISVGRLKDSECVIPVDISAVSGSTTVELRLRKKGKKKTAAVPHAAMSPEHLKKTYQKQLVEDYLSFRTGRMTLQEYTTRAITCSTELMKFEGKEHYYRLIRLHMYILKKEQSRVNQEFETISAHEDQMINDPLSTCYYEYLKALSSRDSSDVKRALNVIRGYYGRQPDNFYMFWFILYLDDSYLEDRNKTCHDLMNIVDAGCNSPMLYYELCELYNEYPGIIRELTDSSLRTLCWGFRRHFLNDDVREHFTDIAVRFHGDQTRVFRVLDILYSERPDEKVLSAACTVLIKGGIVSGRAHRYYALGVERNLKIIGLMEYYVKSLDRSEYPVLPKQVVLYFGYEGRKLSDEDLAYLYADIVCHRDDMPEDYGSFSKIISGFLTEQIRQSRIDKNLSLLYREFLPGSEAMVDAARDLSNVIFKRRVYCSSPEITYVTVRHDEWNHVQRVRLLAGEAYVDIVTDNYSLAFEDGEGRVYQGSVDYTLEKTVDESRFLPVAFGASPVEPRTLLSIASYSSRLPETDYEAVKIYKTLLDVNFITLNYRRELNGRVMDYYYEQYEGDIFENYLREVDLDELDKPNRDRAVAFMIDRDLCYKAFDAVKKYGFDSLDNDRMGRLATYLTEQDNAAYDPDLLSMAFALFRSGNLSEPVMHYLIRYARGSSRELISIYRAARNLNFDTEDLPELVITQAMDTDVYSRDVCEAFCDYAGKKGWDTTARAFVNVMSYRQMLQDEGIDEIMLPVLCRFAESGELSENLQKAALLKALSCHPDMAGEYRGLVKKIMDDFENQDMIFPFFSEFAGIVDIPGELYVKTFLIYRTDPGHHVDVHYYIKTGGRPEYHTERMREYFCGYFADDFELFDDEELKYYVVDQSEGREKRIESDEVKLSKRLPSAQFSRFEMLNRITQSIDRDIAGAGDDLRLYIKDQYLVDTNMSVM